MDAALAPGSGPDPAETVAPGPWREFWRTPWATRVYLSAGFLAALVLPVVLHGRLGPVHPERPGWVTAGVLVLISVLNVEISRVLSGGLERTDQPHKALSAWAFASGLLLPTPWLLVVVPITYAHARWRGLRLPLWKWVGSAEFLVLCGVATAATRHVLVGDRVNWMAGDGGRGLAAMLVAAAVFLTCEALLFTGSALLGRSQDEVWLRRMLTSWSFYTTESAVLIIGGLLSALWTGGAWFVVLLVPIYALAQRAALLDPMRERAAASAELAAKNTELEHANAFKVDLIGMLGHEIGNPLTSIIGFSQLGLEALDDADVAAARHALEVVDGNAARLRAVLHEILALVSTDSGSLTARPEPCPVLPHLASAAAGQPADRRPTVTCSDDLVALVQPGHLDQVLVNLLSNAEKYAGGATELTAASVGGHVEVQVVDTGPGIPGEFRDRLFQRFSRNTDATPDAAGTGLGLFISRELARANGGDLGYRPGAAGGSVFVVRLPEAG